MSVAEPVAGPAPIRLKKRPDLVCSRQHWQGVEYWVVKEPLGQKFYQFPPQVYFLLEQLNGQRSLPEILENYHSEFSPKRLSLDQLHNLLQRFHRDGLVLSDSAGQGIELLKRGRKQRGVERLQSLSNVLAIRFRGFDPERLLNWLNPLVWWVFTRWAGVFFGLAAAVALLSVLINWTEFTARLPGFDQFFDYRRWLMFGTVIGVAKVIHEFGHGLACKRFGGECHEIGFMLLVFTPCLYCNVTDSWRLPNKWHRAMIGAAGMYFEIILATIATFVWWFASPGIVQEICLQFMLVASVSTVLFNGNPLLRFDGYYILGDLLEIPNLQQKSARALTTLMGRHWLGLELPDDPLLPRNRMLSFALFTIASTIYKWVIMVSILIFLTRWLRPSGLESIGKGIAWFSVAGMFVWPLYRLFKFFSVPGKLMQIKPQRFAIATAILAVVLGGILFIPFPSHLRCRVILLPGQLESIYASEPGRLEEATLVPGTRVQAGEILARLRNEQLELDLARNTAKLLETRSKRDQIVQSATQNPASARQMSSLPSLEAEIVRLEESGRLLEQRLGELELRSGVDGVVVATPWQPRLPGSVETPLIDKHPLTGGVQVHPTLNRGDRFCEVADLSRWQGVVLLTEDQIKFVQTGQSIRIRLHSHPGTTIRSTLTGIGASDQILGRNDRNETADQAQSRVRLPDPVLELIPQSMLEQVRYFGLAELQPPEGTTWQIGLDGQCRIKTGYRSLWQRARWWFNQNFGG